MKKAICVPILLAGLTVLTVLAPVHAQNGEGSTPGTSSSQWLDYKADPQRTSSVHVSLGATPPNLVWRHSSELPARSGDAAPLVIGPPGQRRIYFAADKVVVCLDGQTGDEVKRSKPFNASIASPLALMPSEAGDLILAVTNRGELSALRASDLGSVWQTLADKQKTVSVLNSAPFIVKTSGGDRIILALGTGRLVAFDLKGQLDPNWSVVLGSFSSAPTATASVSRDGSLLYVPTQDKRVWVVNVANARVEYSISMRNAVFASPIVTDAHLIVASGSSLNGLQLNTGREDWIFDVKSDLSAPAAFKNADGTTTIFVGARNGRFYALNGANGRVLWSTDLADSITGAATATNDMVLVGTRNGVLFGLSPSDGKVIWRYRLHTERAIPQQRGRGRFGNGGFGNGGFGNGGFPAAGGFPGAGAAVPGGGGFGGFGGVGGDATADPDASPDGEDEPEDGEAGGGFGGNGGPEQPDGGFPGGYPGTTGADLMATADTRNEKNPPVWDTTPTTTYGVSTTPVVLSDQVYILADNTALYSFDTRPFDADPPQLINPQLSILNTESKPALQRLDGDKGWLGPGRGPVEFVAELNDVGSGVDPTSIRVTLNGQELPPEAVASYSDINGKLLVKLTDPQIPERVNLEDGNQTLVLTARDYRGNELVRTVTFMVDNTAPVPRPAPVRQNWRGRGF